MSIVNGSRVRLHYTLTVDGEDVDSSRGGEPFEFVVGEGRVIDGLEEALLGMQAGDARDVQVPPEKGYGPRHEDGIHKVPMAAFEDASKLEVGEMVEGMADGEAFQARITELSLEEVTLDFNHPLAGKNLNFAVEIVEVA